jgi:hypothetical protein
MRRRPLVFFAASTVFLCFPFLLLWNYFNGEPVPSSDWVLYGLLPLLLTVGLIQVSKVAWYTLFGFIFIWGIQDFRNVGSEEANLVSIISHLVIYLLSLSYFINPRIRRLYFDPKLRWWRTKERHETHGPVIFKSGDKFYYPTLKNISEGGCFIETPHTKEIADVLEITIPFPIPMGISAVQTKGEVRWVSENPQRMGMGVQFLGLSTEQIAAIKQFLAHQS